MSIFFRFLKPQSQSAFTSYYSSVFTPIKHLCTQQTPIPLLNPSDSKLLDLLSDEIRSHHVSSSIGSSSLPTDFTIPSLSSRFSIISTSPPSPHLSFHLFQHFSHLRYGVPFPQILCFFNWWVSSPDTIFAPEPFVEMLDLAGKHHHFHVCWYVLDTMKRLEVPIPTSAFMALIRRYSRAGQPEEAVRVIDRMTDFGVEADEKFFSLLIASLAKGRYGKEAQEVFDSLKERFKPDVVVYSALVHAWCRAGEIKNAEKVFLEMKKGGICPNVYTYTVVIDALCRTGEIPRAQEVLCQMIDAGCKPNAATFNNIIRAHLKAGRTEQVLQVHNQMKQLLVETDVITNNFIISAHCAKGKRNLDAALKVLNAMAVSKNGCLPNAYSFNPILKCVLENGDVRAAHKLYEKMKELDCKGNTVTYNYLIELFGKEKSTDMMMRMKKEMDAEGIEPNANTYKVLLKAFCERGHWKKAYQLLREMVEDKCLKPSIPVYEKVFTLMKNAGKLNHLGELVEKMEERGFIRVRSPQ